MTMSDFRHAKPPRNYFARREQWRLLGLVMALGLVVILMNEARDPRNYDWLLQLDQRGGAAEPEATDIDNLYDPPPNGGEVPGSFIARAEPREAEVDTTGRYFPGVKPGYLEKVRDDAPFGSAGTAEHLAWLNLLEILSTTDREKLEEASTGRVTYAQLDKQSDDYRGKLVTVLGIARRSNPAGVPKNDLGIEKYHQVLIFPDDNPTSPLVAYVLDLPEGFPQGMEIHADVTMTGFFFKRWSYLGGDRKLRVAPVLLARTLSWRRPLPPKPPPSTDPLTLGMIVGVAFLAALVIVVFAVRRTAEVGNPAEPLPETIEPVWDAGPPSESGMKLDESLDPDREE